MLSQKQRLPAGYTEVGNKITLLNAKQLKAAQKALRYYQALDETLFEGGLIEHAKEIEGAWALLCRDVTTTLRDNPALGSTLLPTTKRLNKRNANPSAYHDPSTD